MIKKTIMSMAIATAMLLPAAPAAADPPSWAPAHGWHKKHDKKRSYRSSRYDDRRYDRRYDTRNYRQSYEPYRMSRGDRYWRGDDGRYYCNRKDGTTGLIIGAAGGALLGREVDGGRDRTLGTIVGAAAGAFIGREIARGNARCR